MFEGDIIKVKMFKLMLEFGFQLFLLPSLYHF